MFVYVYIEREIEREREMYSYRRGRLYMYIYICIYSYSCIDITLRETKRASNREREHYQVRTNIVPMEPPWFKTVMTRPAQCTCTECHRMINHVESPQTYHTNSLLHMADNSAWSLFGSCDTNKHLVSVCLFATHHELQFGTNDMYIHIYIYVYVYRWALAMDGHAPEKGVCKAIGNIKKISSHEST